MSTVKIKTSLEHRYNKSINLLGNVISFNEEGATEISKELFLEVKEIDLSLSLLDKSSDTSTKQKEVNNEQINVIVEENKELQKIEETKQEEILVSKEEIKEEIKESVDFSSLSVKELKEIAKEANLPETEYDKLSKPKLVEYLSSKI